jgi:hypothetical protein
MIIGRIVKHIDYDKGKKSLRRDGNPAAGDE